MDPILDAVKQDGLFGKPLPDAGAFQSRKPEPERLKKDDKPSEMILGSLRDDAKEGNLDGVKKIIEIGVDVNITNGKSSTALMYAAANGCTKIIEYLLDKGAEIGIKDEKEYSALLLACLYGQEEATRLLIERGADVNSRDGDGKTPLMYAAGIGSVSLVKLLLEKGADARIYDGHYRNAWWWAVQGGGGVRKKDVGIAEILEIRKLLEGW